MPALPQELVDEVVDFIESPKVLYTLSLTHRIFLYQCQKNLFNSVELANHSKQPPSPFPCELDFDQDKGLRLAYILKTSSFLPTLISHLTISCGGSVSHTQEFLSSPIHTLHSLTLKDAWFSGNCDSSDQSLTSFLKSNPCLKEIQIINATVGDLRELFPYPLTDPHFLPNLDSLTIDKVEWRPSPCRSLSQHLEEIFSSSSTSPSRKLHLRSLTLGSLEHEVFEYLFMHPLSIFDLNNSSSEIALRFLPLVVDMSEDHINLLIALGGNLDKLDLMRSSDWMWENLLFAERPVIPNVTHLTIDCSESRTCSGFFSWIADLIRDTKVKTLTFLVDQLDGPFQEYNGSRGDDTEGDPYRGYVDEQNGEGHDEEDEGPWVISNNNVVDKELAGFLDNVADGDLRLRTPFGKDGHDKKLQILFVVGQLPHLNPGKDVVKQYLPQAWAAAEALGIAKIDISLPLI